MRDMILILDTNTHQSIAMARKLRAQRIYCKIVPGDSTAADIQAQNPSGLVWVDGDPDAALDPGLLSLGLPVLAVGNASRMLLRALGGTCQGAVLTQTAAPVEYDAQLLFEGVSPGERWFHRAERLELPDSLMTIATANGHSVAFCAAEQPLYGLQFQIERNDPDGMAILGNFALRICRCTAWWSSEAFIERAVTELSRLAGDGPLLCAMSGGVDSSVCALLAHRAVGSRAHCVFIDTGLMRKDEGDQIEAFYRGELGLPLIRINAQERFLSRLSGITNHAQKEAIVHDEFLQVLLSHAGENQGILVQGTNYPHFLFKDVPTYPNDSPFQAVIEPLRELFKDEVRQVGELLNLPAAIIRRQPFPGAGLASRILGEITHQRVALLRSADALFQEEVTSAGQDRRLAQYYAILAEMPDKAAPGEMIVLRAIVSGEGGTAARLPYDLLERVVERIRQELPAVRRVLYDITPQSTLSAHRVEAL